MRKVTLKLTGENTPVTYKFSAVEESSWAHATIDEVAGSLQLNTDWGDWAYRWNHKYLGDPSLHAFIGHAHYDYLAGKLLGSKRSCFSSEKTANSIKQELLRLRRRDELNEWDARDFWESVDSLSRDAGTDQSFFFLSLNDDIHKFIHVWDYSEDEESRDYKVLCEIILPPLAEICRLNAHKYKAGVGLIQHITNVLTPLPEELAKASALSEEEIKAALAEGRREALAAETIASKRIY